MFSDRKLPKFLLLVLTLLCKLTLHESNGEVGLFKSWSIESGLEEIDVNQRNYGVAVTDVNFDGDFELIVAGFSGPNIVLHFNKEKGKLENLSKKGSIYESLSDPGGQAIGLSACDIDGDGKEEIYFLNTNDAYAGLSSYGDKLFKWRNGQYINLFDDPLNRNISAKNFAGRSVSCLDRYGSGKYGFMIATYARGTAGSFALIEMDEFHAKNDVDTGYIVLKDSAAECGLKKSTGGRSIAVGPILNADGKSDIFFGNEGNSFLGNLGDNFLFKNVGNGTFVDVAKQLDLSDSSESVRGVALADLDNNGLLDLIYSNWDGPTRIYMQSIDSEGMRHFQDVATPDLQKRNVVRTVMVADFDNNKNLEIIINNIDNRVSPQPNVGFTVTSYGPNNPVGISKISLGDATEADMYGTGGAYADIDGDGRLEMLLSHGESVPQPLEIYKVTSGEGNNWIRIFPKTKYGAPARGATVSVKTRSGDVLTRVIDGGSGYLCQMEPVAHFGLHRDQAVSLTVKFPDGKTTEKSLSDSDNNKVIRVVHPHYERYQQAQHGATPENKTKEACECVMTHPQNSFCSANFVIKAKVRQMKYVFRKRLTDHVKEPFERRYSIKVRNIYKGKEALRNIDQMHVFSSAQDSICGVILETGHTYVIAGSIRNNKMNIDACHFVKIWENLPKWQRRGIENRYAQNCDCQPKVCYSDECQGQVKGREDICIVDLHRDRLKCHVNHSFCKRVNGECTWSRTSQFRDCSKRMTLNDGLTKPQT